MAEKTFVVVPFMIGNDGDIAFSMINATFQDSGEATKRFPHPLFGEWLIEQIYTSGQILAKTKGLFGKKKYICPSCAAELDRSLKTPLETSIDLKFKEFPPFTIRATLPAVKCPQCGKNCGIDPDGSVSYRLNEAIIRAFESQNIKP